VHNETAIIVTVGTGSARNGVIERVVGSNRTMDYP
jgi:hypothetical protein